MSVRSMRRARQRAAERGRQRTIGLARRAMIGTAVLGASGVAAQGAAAAPFTVTNTLDTGGGSLRNALGLANSTAGPDTIDFASNVTGTITLTSGILVATESVSIDGPGAAALKVVSPSSGAFFLNDFSAGGSTLELEGLTIEGHSSGGGSCGGGIVVGGSAGGLNLRNVTISGSTASNQGGAICSKETSVSLVDSTLSGNTAGGDGGAIYIRGASVSSVGSTLTGNKTSGNGGAIEIRESAGPKQASLTSVDSQISNNQAIGKGGGIDLLSADGPASIQGTTISGNSAQVHGGGIAVQNIASDITIERSSITGNHAGNIGGGLYMAYGGALKVDSSTIANNVADFRAGGLLVYGPRGPFTMSDSTVAGNSAPADGGVSWWNLKSQPGTIENSTISGNTATNRGGGIYRAGQNALSAAGSDLTLSSTVVAANVAPVGPDINQAVSAQGSVVVGNSFIGSTAGVGVISESPAGTNTLDGGDPGLSPLAVNGGPTMTLLPAASSPLVDAGVANGLSQDQRGSPRTAVQSAAFGPGSDGTDIGAVELDDSGVVDPSFSAKRKQKQKGRKIAIVVEAGAGESATATATGVVKLGKKKLPLSHAGEEVPAGGTATLKLNPKSKRSTRKIARALGRGKKAKATVTVDLNDPLGHIAEQQLKVVLVQGGKKQGHGGH